MQPELKTTAAFTVTGLNARTTNAAEQHQSTASIGPLWQRFYTSPLLGKGAIYGVYSQYESDMNGAFDVTAGIDQALSGEGLHTLQIQAGDYLVFRSKGAMPQAVIDGWMQIWQHFANPRDDVQRCYGTDFEHYLGADEVAIHIGVTRLAPPQ
jgi:predicted transcriptional regulator YdeE